MIDISQELAVWIEGERESNGIGIKRAAGYFDGLLRCYCIRTTRIVEHHCLGQCLSRRRNAQISSKAGRAGPNSLVAKRLYSTGFTSRVSVP